MALQVCNGAMLMCSMGVAPSTLVVTPEKMVNTSSFAGQTTHMIP